MTAFTTRPEILGTFGVVTSTHWIASAVGMSILEKGGNAFDAAVAAGFTLQILEPHLVGPGGDMPAIIYSKKKDKVEVICAQGPAPAGATIEHYTSEGLKLVPGMPVEAFIQTGERTIVSYLTKPFTDQALKGAGGAIVSGPVRIVLAQHDPGVAHCGKFRSKRRIC